MSSSFTFDHPDHFTTGTIGEPGHRVFFIQARQDGEVASLRLEKQQVAALGEYLGGILADLPDAEPAVASAELIEPAIAEWAVRTLAVAYEETDDLILLVAEELQVESEDDPEGLELEDPASARFRLTRAQTAAFIERASELVMSGRPLCRLCGQPMDPDGHPCPRLN
jgi:uncharacterized repeat protein (TIGR03847 family)